MEAIVVDDSKAMRMILRRILSKRGFSTVHEAGDGVEALETLKRTGPIALALVDWNMPHMNGYDFVRLVRARRDFDGLRVMMVTTETDIEKVAAALEAGADEYVMKPFSDEVISQKLQLLGLGAA